MSQGDGNRHFQRLQRLLGEIGLGSGVTRGRGEEGGAKGGLPTTKAGAPWAHWTFQRTASAYVTRSASLAGPVILLHREPGPVFWPSDNQV